MVSSKKNKEQEEPKKKILVVDDEVENINLFVDLFDTLGYDTITAANGKEAVDKANKHIPDIILMDVRMPVMDGFEATEILKGNKKTSLIPIIILTALGTRENLIKGISKGANDYLLKPVDLHELHLRVQNNLKIKEYQDFLRTYNKTLEQKVEERTKDLQDALRDVDKAYEDVKSGYIDTIHRLAIVSEYKDVGTGMHIKRTGIYTKMITEKMGMDKNYVNTIFYASPMHDIGKVGIPDSILLKPAHLTPYEWEVMMTHTTIGADILKGSKSPFIKMAAEIALSHHEKWDGSGYPQGLKGKEINLGARIMTIVDQYDALRCIRTYKPAFDHERVVEIITKGDGRTMPEHFDPEVLEFFKKYHEHFDEIYEMNKDM